MNTLKTESQGARPTGRTAIVPQTVLALTLALGLVSVAPGPAAAQEPPTLPALPAPPSLTSLPVLPSFPSGAPNNPGLLSQRASRTKNFSRTFPVNGRSVSIEGRAMDLRVARGTSDQATLEVTLEYWSPSTEWMDLVESEYEVIVDERGTGIEIDTGKMPEADESWWRRVFGNRREISWALTAVLNVPANTPLEVENRYGDTDITGVGGPISIDSSSGEVSVHTATDTEISNNYGPITVEEITGELRIRGGSAVVEVSTVRGRVDIETSYSGMKVTDIEGDLRASVSSGAVRVTNVSGLADVSNSYAEAEIRNVGSLQLRTSSGNVTVREVAGDASIDSSYGEVSVEDVQGALTVESPSSAVTLSRIGSDATVSNSYATVRASTVGGNLEIDGSSTGVDVRDVTGGVDVRTSYSGVDIRGVGGTVAVRNQSGRVAVSDFTGAALTARHRIETSYANIEILWPADTPIGFDAECTYGSIDSEFGGETTASNSSRKRLSLAAEGGGFLDLVSSSGSIRIRRR